MNGPDAPTQDPPRPLVTRIRGFANTMLLIGVLVFAIGWIVKASTHFMATVGLLMVSLFLVSSIAILIENRRIAHSGGRP